MKQIRPFQAVLKFSHVGLKDLMGKWKTIVAIMCSEARIEKQLLLTLCNEKGLAWITPMLPPRGLAASPAVG